MALSIQKESSNGTTVLKIHGILDISTAFILEQFIQELENVRELIIDFSNLEFIDSTGVGVIIEFIYLSQEKNFTIRFQGIDEQTYEIFETIGLFKVLEAFQDGHSNVS
ncbi:anti-anti-sigma factor [Anoxybacillus calidus]|jgi:anti-anti-sigma factor|uniref:Anti-anti-sigma factor n=1 Tax=[Anoxybacillus] calidus TaxID=575178 RepID=A0A7W0BVW3_9BACL|nr:STAS domain-containing protein [Anoxybacillus calidus]MBA2870384.1 anti-anti-sigma factor [Anoxybacillus calidus]